MKVCKSFWKMHSVCLIITFPQLSPPTVTALLLCTYTCSFYWSYLRLGFYCFLHPFPFLLGEAQQENFWLSCPTVPEAGGRSETLNGQEPTTEEERCHFPFWYQGRLRYECVELDTTSSTSSQVVSFNSILCASICKIIFLWL